jgi:glutamyl-tRNA(Gln) amidotransferase subunit E
MAVNLPDFKGILSHFTQPGKMFSDEISDRLKVIACIEKPHMSHTEELKSTVSQKDWQEVKKVLKASDNDAQLIIWGPEDDIPTALETIEERCKMAFEGVPNETRKSFEDGTTIFERVLPGADRMYPDTDSPPIPLEDSHITEVSSNLPSDIIDRYNQLKKWNVPEDTYTYIFSKNLYPIMERIVKELKMNARLLGTFIGHHLKWVEGQFVKSDEFSYDCIYDLIKFLKKEKLDVMLAGNMLPVLYEHPKMDFESVLTSIGFKRTSKEDITSKIMFLKNKFQDIRVSQDDKDEVNWIMGAIRPLALGNMPLKEVKEIIKNNI